MSFPAKLTVGSTFSTQPPRGGGQLRVLHLYRQLARHCPVEVIALVAEERRPREIELAPGLREVRVPKSAAHIRAEWELEREAGVPVTDVAFPGLHSLTPEFVQAIARSAAGRGALVASHPYTLPALVAADGRLPVWYEVQDVEADLKALILAQNKTGRRLLADTREVERACCERAELVLAPSRDNADRLRSLYGVAEERVVLVPNGVDAGAIPFNPPSARRRLRERLRMNAPIALFVGSWHEPNLRALRRIVELAPLLPEVEFAVAGSACVALDEVRAPSNVTRFGVIADAQKQALLSVAAVALNPMSEGSGTNIKMLDYLAAGAPVVTTEIGARGLDLDPERHARIVPLEGFAAAIRNTLAEPVEEADSRAQAARQHVEENFDWAVVARELVVVADRFTPSDPVLTAPGSPPT